MIHKLLLLVAGSFLLSLARAEDTPANTPAAPALPVKQVALRVDTNIDVVKDGKPAGSYVAKAWTVFKIIEIQNNRIHIGDNTQEATVPIADTDYQDRYNTLAQVALKAEAKFDVMRNGKVAGSIALTTGDIADIVEVKGDTIRLACRSSEATIPLANTDYADRRVFYAKTYPDTATPPPPAVSQVAASEPAKDATPAPVAPAVANSGGDSSHAKLPDPESVLFIGDSYTTTYNIPGIFEALATHAGKKMTVASHVGGGKELAWLWANPEGTVDHDYKPWSVQDHIKSKKWGMIVLQNGDIPTPDTDVAAFKKILPEYLALANAQGSRVLLHPGFFTPFLYMEPKHIKVGMDICTEVSNLSGILCAPVMLALQNFREKYPDIALEDKEPNKKYAQNVCGGHPSPFASYLAACTIYAATYDESPVGNPYRECHWQNGSAKTDITFDEADAKEAQEVAWDTWNKYKSSLKAY